MSRLLTDSGLLGDPLHHPITLVYHTNGPFPRLSALGPEHRKMRIVAISLWVLQCTLFCSYASAKTRLFLMFDTQEVGGFPIKYQVPVGPWLDNETSLDGVEEIVDEYAAKYLLATAEDMRGKLIRVRKDKPPAPTVLTDMNGESAIEPQENVHFVTALVHLPHYRSSSSEVSSSAREGEPQEDRDLFPTSETVPYYLGTVLSRYNEGVATCQRQLEDNTQCDPLAVVARFENPVFQPWVMEMAINMNPKVPGASEAIEYWSETLNEMFHHMVPIWEKEKKLSRERIASKYRLPLDEWEERKEFPVLVETRVWMEGELLEDEPTQGSLLKIIHERFMLFSSHTAVKLSVLATAMFDLPVGSYTLSFSINGTDMGWDDSIRDTFNKVEHQKPLQPLDMVVLDITAHAR